MTDIGYSGMEALINEWVIGKNGERDREIMRYLLLDGLTRNEITTRYMLAHPDKPITIDTVNRAIRKRRKQIYAHYPG